MLRFQSSFGCVFQFIKSFPKFNASYFVLDVNPFASLISTNRSSSPATNPFVAQQQRDGRNTPLNQMPPALNSAFVWGGPLSPPTMAPTSVAPMFAAGPTPSSYPPAYNPFLWRFHLLRTSLWTPTRSWSTVIVSDWRFVWIAWLIFYLKIINLRLNVEHMIGCESVCYLFWIVFWILWSVKPLHFEFCFLVKRCFFCMFFCFFQLT